MLHHVTKHRELSCISCCISQVQDSGSAGMRVSETTSRCPGPIQAVLGTASLFHMYFFYFQALSLLPSSSFIPAPSTFFPTPPCCWSSTLQHCPSLPEDVICTLAAMVGAGAVEGGGQHGLNLHPKHNPHVVLPTVAG